jgi:microcystin-dependent protein
MPALPNLPIDEIADPTEVFDPTSTTQEYTILEDITVADSAGPEAANRQPKALDQRTETLRGRLNKIIETLNATEASLLSRDGTAVGSVMLGDLSMKNPSTLASFRVINMADGVDDTDAVTKQQLDAVQAFLTALQVSLVDFVKRDGTQGMLANLDMANNQIINLGTPVNAADGVTKAYADAAFDDLETDFVRRDGSLVMLGSLDMGGNKIINLDLATPTDAGDGISKSYLDTVIASLAATPTGTIAYYAGDVTISGPPVGWLLCTGASFTSAQQPALHALLSAAGYPYGGAGANFNVPDFRGRVALGLDNMGGSSANVVTDPQADILGGALGTETVTLTTPQLPSHTHTFDDQFVDANTGGAFTGPAATDNNNTLNTVAGVTAATGGGAAHPNIQPTMAVNVIIKT